ncbi:hypothetical protein B0J12DRAFT_677897 [Macrophomina phaseolina]|uniref:Early meiotic induction protein 1 n=1 Tax=Macrophomina phaseolina TaxID=35725 RepID=A0ABQ8FZ09_9PEZI|nr:hypothetical protein B0J12DRAFT_677897 [Macrophomina phaseolina]
MGWWWRSDPQSPVTNPSDPTPDPIPTSSQPPASPRDVADAPKTLSRNEQADADLKAFLSELQASVEPNTSATPNDVSTTQPAQTQPAQPQPPSIFPTTMNCRQAFEEAFYCQSLGGQFMNVYRYGTLRSCSDNWADFWFCMRIKSYGDAEKAKLISEHYRQKEAKYRKGPSSEDVWAERKPGEELRNPFSKDPDEVEIPGLPKRRRQQQEQ